MASLRSVLLFAALPLAAQTGQPVELKVTCGRSPCIFKIGEVIPIELSFSSSVAKRFHLNMARYDRSGRMKYETFRVSPQEGTRDPLQVYFASAMGMVGGLTTFQFLGAEPTSIALVLNEWVSFDRPGVYRVKTTSTRATDSSVDLSKGEGSADVTSNEMDLEIIAPDVEWQQRELQRIVRMLDDPKRKPDVPGSTIDPLIELRYLGTEAAARELVRRFGASDTNSDSQCMFGLLGSPNSVAGLKEMRARLRDPDFPVTSIFLRTMSYLALAASDSAEVLQEHLQENIEGNRTELISVLSLKRGKALASSTETALQSFSTGSSEGPRKALLQQLRDNFEALSPDNQTSWLQYRWDSIQDRSWIPVLRRVATAYEDYPELREMHAYQSLQASGIALRRWYDLDPEGARSAVIAEIARARPRYGVEVLGMLKDPSLPEVESALVENLMQTDNYEIESSILGLLERFGTGIALPSLIASRGELIGKWACAPQSSFLAYILKFNPQTSRQLIERAIEARGAGRNACRHSIFTDLGARHPGSILEDLAIKGLNDTDSEVSINAATYLGRYGSEAAEEHLWARYILWNRRWLGREQDLRVTFGAGDSPNLSEANLGHVLAKALAQGNGWLSDEVKLRRIRDLAVSDYVRAGVESALKSASNRSISFIRWSPDQPPWFMLAQYDQLTLDQLRTKLAQFPPATLFHWTSNTQASSLEQDRLFREISDAAVKAHMQLIRD